MKTLIIDRVYLYELDSILAGEDLSLYDVEIENIVDNIWNGIGEYEEIISPLFASYLRNHKLCSLYINYLALNKLNKNNNNIRIDASTFIVDIIGRYLNIELNQKRKILDVEFDILCPHCSLRWGLNTLLLKNIVRNVRYYLSEKRAIFKGINVIYMNAGKLKSDFCEIPNSFDCRYMPINTKSNRINWNINKIKGVVRSNIRNMDISIPRELILELVDKSVFGYLPDILLKKIMLN